MREAIIRAIPAIPAGVLRVFGSAPSLFARVGAGGGFPFPIRSVPVMQPATTADALAALEEGSPPPPGSDPPVAAGALPDDPSAALGEILEELVRRGGSDLHLTPDEAPRFRIDGRLTSIGHEPLSAAAVDAMVAAQTPAHCLTDARAGGEPDFGFTLEGIGRFRVSAFLRRGALGAVYRVIGDKASSLDALGLPFGAEGLSRLASGLVLTSGPVGSGKSTTLAAIVDRINKTRPVHVVTIEDPIEVVHEARQALITQRQVGSDTASFHTALRSVLRSDPDVVVIGEIRDRETTDAALRVTETGHLALATIHARSVTHALTRIVEMFPAEQHRQTRVRLAASLEAIYCQRLVPLAGGKGRVLAVEKLAPTQAARNLIREDKLHQLFAVMDAAARQGSCISLNESLAGLCRRALITREAALAVSNDPEQLDHALQSVSNGRGTL